MAGKCGPPQSFYVLLVLVFVGLFILAAAWPSSTSPEGYDNNYSLAYGNDSTRPSHPVLGYQRESSYGTHPASYGDPIRPPPSMLGPSSLGSYYGSSGSRAGPGPFVGKPMGIPVPQGAFKETNERWRRPFYDGYNLPVPDYNGLPTPMSYNMTSAPSSVFPQLERPLPSADFFRPYGPNAYVDGSYADIPFYRRGGGRSPLYSDGSPRFVGSVDAFAPFPEVTTPWEKIGIVSSTHSTPDNTIFNLYRRPIAPLQDLFEYTVQDKNGFVIPLHQKYLENNDIIPDIKGYEGKGPWKADIFVNNKYIWM